MLQKFALNEFLFDITSGIFEMCLGTAPSFKVWRQSPDPEFFAVSQAVFKSCQRATDDLNGFGSNPIVKELIAKRKVKEFAFLLIDAVFGRFIIFACLNEFWGLQIDWRENAI